MSLSSEAIEYYMLMVLKDKTIQRGNNGAHFAAGAFQTNCFSLQLSTAYKNETLDIRSGWKKLQ